jgi:hypothetical protein
MLVFSKAMLRESKEKDWMPLKGLRAISDVLPPEAYANPGYAEVINKFVRRFRRRAAFSAFWSGISQGELSAILETHALLYTAVAQTNAPDQL